MISSFNRKLAELSKKKENLFFVQVRANDGYTDDPIHDMVKKYKWSGVLVEPVPEYFEKLKLAYKNIPNLTFVNSAISIKNETRTLYGFSKKAPFWIKMHTKTKNSFSKETILSHSWYMPNLEKYIVGQKVKSINIKTLLDKYSDGKVDMLFIDTEGYDFEILKQFNLKKNKPLVIYYEHKHLSASDRSESWKILLKHGYKIEKGLWNTLAYIS